MFDPIITKVKSKSIRIRITPDGKAEIRVPLRTSQRVIEEILRENRAQIEKMIQQHEARKQQAQEHFGVLPVFDENRLAEYTEQTRRLLNSRLDGFARQIGVTYCRVSVKKAVSRWGSCSSKGNLNFNCLLAAVPPEVADYIMVHELCHRKQMNHSPAFWAEVERILPDYRQSEQWLKQYGSVLTDRLRQYKEEQNG